MEKFFKLKENKTNVKTEIIAGVTTFMTIAYILAVNPAILSVSGMDSNAILVATAISASIGTLLMALLTNYPFALAPALGLNAYFAYTVCNTMGYSWQFALLAVFVEGIIFIILSLVNAREAIFNAIPFQLKKGISIGIGFFVAFIGLVNAHIVVKSDATLVTLVNFHDNFSTMGIGAILAIIGLLITVALYEKHVKGSILIGIFVTWGLGMLSQAIGLYQPDVANGFYSLYPSLNNFDITSITKTFGQCFNFSEIGKFNIIDFVIVMTTFLFIDIFDTIGSLIGCADKAKMLDKDGKLPKVKQALLSDAIATSVGAILGTTTVTTYVESSTGIAAGGRTGLASVVTSILFLAALIFAPIFTAIPGFATAPALIFVGFLIITTISEIKFDNLRESVPAYLVMISMPLLFSISDGIAIGIISYTVINILTGNAKKVSVLMYILTILFAAKYIFL